MKEAIRRKKALSERKPERCRRRERDEARGIGEKTFKQRQTARLCCYEHEASRQHDDQVCDGCLPAEYRAKLAFAFGFAHQVHRREEGEQRAGEDSDRNTERIQPGLNICRVKIWRPKIDPTQL